MPSKRIELSKITLFHATPSLPNEAKGYDDKKIQRYKRNRERTDMSENKSEWRQQRERG